jgi:hypothetical protein
MRQRVARETKEFFKDFRAPNSSRTRETQIWTPNKSLLKQPGRYERRRRPASGLSFRGEMVRVILARGDYQKPTVESDDNDDEL